MPHKRTDNEHIDPLAAASDRSLVITALSLMATATGACAIANYSRQYPHYSSLCVNSRGHSCRHGSDLHACVGMLTDDQGNNHTVQCQSF